MPPLHPPKRLPVAQMQKAKTGQLDLAPAALDGTTAQLYSRLEVKRKHVLMKLAPVSPLRNRK